MNYPTKATDVCANCGSPECYLFTYPHYDEGESKPYTDWLCTSCAREVGFCPSCGCFVARIESETESLHYYGMCTDCAWEYDNTEQDG